MKPIPLLVLAAILLPACAIPGDAAWSDLHASAFGSAYATSFEVGATGITVNDSSGGGVDFSGDLDLESNTSTALYYGARLGFAPLELSVSQFGYDESNDGVVSSGSEFGGTPISGDLDVKSEMDMSVTKVMLGLDIINTSVFRIGLMAGLDYLELDQFDLIAQESQGPGFVQAGDRQTILESQSIPLPLLGIRGDVALPFGTRLGAEVTGMTFNYDDSDLLMLDWDVAAHWEPFSNVEVMVGFRAVKVELDGEVDGTVLDMEMDFQWPYAGITVYI